MAVNLKGRDFLKLLDFSAEEIEYFLDLAADLKDKKKRGIPHKMFEGKNIALIFEKTSTRTRCSFEVAGHDLGMGTTYLDPSGSQIGKKESIADTARVLAGMFDGIEYLDPKGSQIGKKESIADTARVLGRMFDGIEYRGYGQEIVEELAKYSKVPVWNGLTNEFHPTQMLADMLTIRECFGHVKGIKLSFFGDCRYNMANSWMVAGAKMGMHITLCANKKYFPEEELVKTCREIAAASGGSITLTEDAREGAKGADVLYTDVWVSMGEPMEAWAERIQEMKPYQVTQELMDLAGEKAVFMHCLPAFHDQGTGIGRQIFEQFGMAELEVTDEVFEGPQSVVFEEAENRMHTIKAVMAATL